MTGNVGASWRSHIENRSMQVEDRKKEEEEEEEINRATSISFFLRL